MKKSNQYLDYAIALGLSFVLIGATMLLLIELSGTRETIFNVLTK